MAASPNTVRLTFTCTQEASARVSVLHYRTSSPHVWTTAELLTLATNFWTAIATPWKALTSATTSPVSVTAQDLGTIPGAVAVYNIPSGNAGQVAGEADPASASAVISWKGPFSGRRYQGRTFTFGLAELSTNGSTVVSATMTLLFNYALAVGNFTNSGGQTVHLAILSRILNASVDALSFIIDTYVDSQRRRLLNRGN